MKGRVLTGIAVFVAAGLTLAAMGRAASMLVVALFVSFGIWLTRSEWPAR